MERIVIRAPKETNLTLDEEIQEAVNEFCVYANMLPPLDGMSEYEGGAYISDWCARNGFTDMDLAIFLHHQWAFEVMYEWFKDVITFDQVLDKLVEPIKKTIELRNQNIDLISYTWEKLKKHAIEKAQYNDIKEIYEVNPDGKITHIPVPEKN